MASNPDVGMAVKMNTVSFPGYYTLARGEAIDETAILERCDYVDERHDCADFRLIVLLQTLIAYGDRLSEKTTDRMLQTIRSFKYWMDEPGEDGMCFWSENHQLLFATCEYFAGTLLEHEIFSNSGMTGAMHRDKALPVLRNWFDQKLERGFIEWHSNTYYEEDIAPLCVLADYAPDDDLARSALLTLDVLMLDFAHHSFEGRFHASSGRCYELPKKDSGAVPVNPILRHAFSDAAAETSSELTLSALFVTCQNYRVPKAIRAIWENKDTVLVKESSGYDLRDVRKLFPEYGEEDLGRLFWAMEAFTNVESVETTIRLFLRWKLETNVFLKDLRMIAKPWLLKLRALPLLVKTLNPATQGVAIQKADVTTYRTKDYQLSCVERHHPGEFADQQHVWHACLPQGINLFSTHPGSPMFDDSARNFSPSYWVGNGIFPDAVQEKNMLILIYDTTPRKGFLERVRQHYVHFYVPFAKFAETNGSSRTFFGRSGDAYVAILSSHPMVKTGDELQIFAKRSGFAVVLGSQSEDGSFDAFQAKVLAKPFSFRAMKLSFGNASFRYRGAFLLDGKKRDSVVSRWSSPFVTKLEHGAVLIECKGETWILDPNRLERKELFR